MDGRACHRAESHSKPAMISRTVPGGLGASTSNSAKLGSGTHSKAPNGRLSKLNPAKKRLKQAPAEERRAKLKGFHT